MPEISRSTFQRLIVDCHLKINGLPTKPNHRPRAGEVITIRWPTPKSSEVLPQEIPLEILFEDEDVLVINKPADLVVHPSAGHENGTIVNAVLHHCCGRLSGIGGVIRPGIVHRLDMGTSGCLVVAKNDSAHLKLSEHFAERRVEKIYQMVVCGILTPETGDIRAAIARHPTRRQQMAVVPAAKGRFARTTYQLLEALHRASFVEAVLHTGRTHQIRVHFQHLGFPVLGDDTYGKRQTKRLHEETGYLAPRQLLHARKLTFPHPRTRRLMEFNAPLPEDFRAGLAALQISTNSKGDG
ncbi:MAG: RluA family pseudouridine synthase [Pedosphaera sp.]|nr:RluA family pseudouridine synthase [Pedosphaera sp.]